jgi:hypothetical protein
MEIGTPLAHVDGDLEDAPAAMRDMLVPMPIVVLSLTMAYPDR